MKKPKEDKEIHIVKKFLGCLPWTYCEKYVDNHKATAYHKEATCKKCIENERP